MGVSEEHRVYSVNGVLDRLVSKVGASIDENYGTVIFGNARGGAISVVARVLGGTHLT